MALPHDAAIRNNLLAALPADALAALLPRLSPFVLQHRQTIYPAEAIIDHVYFPETGMFSLVANLEDGTRAEVGVIGREGVLGVSLLSGAETSFVEAMVQMPGSALRMPVREFRLEMETNAAFRSLLQRYAEALQAQVMQTAACNGRHSLEQRLARWLLMARDRSEGDELALTQEFVAMMLGVHRPSVSVAASILQRAGMIRYAGGRITVLNRDSLQIASCECYRAVQRRFSALFDKTPA